MSEDLEKIISDLQAENQKLKAEIEALKEQGTMETLLNDPEVKNWIEQMNKAALLPVKRS